MRTDEKDEYYNQLEELKDHFTELKNENKKIKDELSNVELERDRLETIFSEILKESRLKQFSSKIEHERLKSTSVSFQEVYEINRSSLSIIKFGSLGPELVVTEPLSFKKPETSMEEQEDWLITLILL